MEEWKDVVGYEGIYTVSSLGEIFSNKRSKKLSKAKSSTGYYHVLLYSNRKAKTVNVHTIVADAFLPPKEGCTEVNHKDGDKANNSVSNLERVTRRENIRHAIMSGLRPAKRVCVRKSSWKQKNRRKMHKILQLTGDGELVRVWENYVQLTEETGFDNGNIYKCISGKAKTAYGFLWKYAD